MEHIYVDEVVVPHRIIEIRGDGACLFSSLSFLLYETATLGEEVRTSVVQHVSNNWRRFKVFTVMPNGDTYRTKPLYLAEMSKPETFGTTCELMAAGEMFPYEFQVYRDGTLLAKFGQPVEGVKRLRFTGNLLSGHFDVLIPLVEQPIRPPPQPIPLLSIVDPSGITEIIPSRFGESDELPQVNVMCDSRRGKKRRARFTDCDRKKRHKMAVQKYSQKNPQVHRASVRIYSEKNPEVNRASVRIYSEKNPEVNRASVAKYRKANPEINRASVRKYYDKRREIKLLPWSVKSLSGFRYDRNIDYNHDKTVSIGERTVCKWCHAFKWKEEYPGMCCSNGKVQLLRLQNPPELLHSLLTDQHPHSEHFLTSIRKYNSCFQMTSFGAKEVREGNFMPTFKIQGQVYHRIGSLIPAPQQQPSFLQIYFVEGDKKERDIRCGNFPDVKPELVGQLQNMLHEHNQYVKDFKAAIQCVDKDQKEFKVVINAEKKPSDAHKGRFNAPATKEVAILMVGQTFEKRDIVVHSRHSKQLQRICETHRSYDTLQYPLMFCHGEDGYAINIPQRDPDSKATRRKTVSAADFYSYRLMEREGEENYLILFRNLLNQFLVDMYAKIETERLNFIKNNQKKLRSENYIHLQDAMKKADAQLSEVGKMVVLPSTFTGGPRYMHERTQDAMTYVRHYGRPDLFVTFTCNPKWPEITNILKHRQKPEHRHDLISRIFHLKVKKMMNLFTKGCLFGPTRCHMMSVEWQKRGLPHVHILLWLQDRIKAVDIDDIICAEIPDHALDPELHDIVKTTMIHGPCGSLNLKSPCMVKGKCSKKFPYPLLEETQTGEDGYPQYRRRSPLQGGFTVIINGVDLDNRWVVPYNPVLSRTFKAHINVEYCNSVKSIKYICKYINKGSDQAAFALENDLNEVSRYETGRYISSSEAAWRIFRFPIHERFPPVMHLAVHLENGQRVYFTADNAPDKISNPRNTTLTAFFELCSKDAFARTLLYCEVPSYFVWRDNKFYRRNQGKPVPGYPDVKKDYVLGRVYTIHPNNTECYHARLLLHEVRGPTSFTSLKTVAGKVHPTFQSACRALGLLEDDAQWDRTLEEAALSDSPHKIRELFAIMLVFCQIADPLMLWQKHRDSLADDVKRRTLKQCHGADIQQISAIIYNECLILLEDIVCSMSGNRLTNYGLPTTSRDQGSSVINHEYLQALSHNRAHLSEIVSQNESKLNIDQKKVYETVSSSIQSNFGSVFFLDAPGGTGKTFLINLLIAKVRMEGNIAIAVASSGIAATLLDGGRTAHSAFKLPLNLNHCETPVCNISKQSDMAQVLRECKLIVWDECTMAHKGGIEALDRTLQDIRNNTTLMGA